MECRKERDTQARTGRTIGRALRIGLRAVMVSLSLAVLTSAIANATGLRVMGAGAAPGVALEAEGDRSGSLPLFSVNGAYPGMAPQESVFEVRNTSQITERFWIETRAGVDRGCTLGRALRIKIVDRSSGETVYAGAPVNLSIQGGVLAPGRSVGYVATISWPRTADDPALQGCTLSLEMTARAAAA